MPSDSNRARALASASALVGTLAGGCGSGHGSGAMPGSDTAGSTGRMSATAAPVSTGTASTGIGSTAMPQLGADMTAVGPGLYDQPSMLSEPT